MSRLHGEYFRRNLRKGGERIEWQRAIDSDSVNASRGRKIYAPVMLDDGVRVFLRQNMQDVTPEEFALIGEGGAMLDFMPDEINPVRDDRFKAVAQPKTARFTFNANGSDVALPHLNVFRIEAVFVDDAPLLQSRFVLQNNSIVWQGSAPTGKGVAVISYHPTYELLGEAVKQGPMGIDNVRLPSSCPLKLLTAGEE